MKAKWPTFSSFSSQFCLYVGCRPMKAKLLMKSKLPSCHSVYEGIFGNFAFTGIHHQFCFHWQTDRYDRQFCLHRQTYQHEGNFAFMLVILPSCRSPRPTDWQPDWQLRTSVWPMMAKWQTWRQNDWHEGIFITPQLGLPSCRLSAISLPLVKGFLLRPINYNAIRIDQY